ncbi:LemA family protein [Patescibacteria group bacterium]|nr:LemA family protein [Patescibacteria group bacterium]
MYGIILIGIIAIVAVYLWATYNGLITAKLRVDESWSGIDVQLKRRAALIPNLVETVKGYAAHEKGVFQEVTEARSALMSASTPKEKAQADNMLSSTLKSLFAVAEAYPDLKANENFKHLQEELTDAEDKVAYARQFYNTNVMEYNIKLKVFPSVLVANMFGFKSEEFFEAEEGEREDVKVGFTAEEKPE